MRFGNVDPEAVTLRNFRLFLRATISEEKEIEIDGLGHFSIEFQIFIGHDIFI